MKLVIGKNSNPTLVTLVPTKKFNYNKAMKKIIILIVSLFSFNVFSNAKDLGMVQKLAAKYISLAQSGNFSAIYDQLIDNSSKTNFSKKEFLEANIFNDEGLDKALYGNSNFSFLFMDVGNGKGTFTIKVMFPDIMSAMMNVKNELKDSSAKITNEEVHSRLTDSVFGGSIPLKEHRITMNVVKTRGFWRILTTKQETGKHYLKEISDVKDKIYELVSTAKRQAREASLKDEVMVYYFEHNFDKTSERVSEICRSDKRKFMIRPRGLFSDTDCSLENNVYTCSKEKDSGVSTLLYEKKQLCEIALTDMKNKMSEREAKTKKNEGPSNSRALFQQRRNQAANQNQMKKNKKVDQKLMNKCRMIYFNSGCYKENKKLPCYEKATRDNSVQAECMEKDIVEQVVR